MKTRQRVAVALASVGAVLGCNILDLPTEASESGSQRWRFDLSETSQSPVFTSSTANCLPGGACGTFTWTLLRTETFGCRFDYAFEVQFSGDQIRILLGKVGPASSCAGMSLGTNFGNGVANAAYPSATAGSGNVTINLNSPIGPSGGTSFFRATRVQ